VVGSAGSASTATLELMRVRVEGEAVHDGSVRPLRGRRRPSSRMKRVGEIVSRPVFGLSTPRGASAPPQTADSGAAALTASYVAASSAR
jgi:hypothetical protein